MSESPLVHRIPEPIPAPASFRRRPGLCRLGPQIAVAVVDRRTQPRAAREGESAQAMAAVVERWIAELAAGSGWQVERSDSESAAAVCLVWVDVELLGDDRLADEAYVLRVAPEGIELQASCAQGLFRGLQTLWQCLPPECDPLAMRGPRDAVQCSVALSCVAIEDRPRFAWRGFMLDVCRHFHDKAMVMRHMTALARYKINSFHLHLTDDQGWRIEIEGWPKLTQLASTRAETPVLGDKNRGDGVPHSGYFTKADIRDILAHAESLHMRVVPEIEMPGHARAVLAAYPELGNCPDRQLPVATTWGIHDVVFGVGEQTFQFLESVLEEVIALFPGEFVHIGGDEVPKQEWRASDRAQALMRDQGLADEDELQSYFIRHFDRFLSARGRRLVGWDEILEGGLAQGATVMSWRGIEGGIAAATAGHDVVMCPTSHAYFDYYQARDRDAEPCAVGGYIPLARVYEFEPIPDELAPKYHHHILGGQANLWTECIPSTRQAEFQTFPRILAMAEVLWSPRARRDYSDFCRRLEAVLDRLATQGINYREPTGEPAEHPPVPPGEWH